MFWANYGGTSATNFRPVSFHVSFKEKRATLRWLVPLVLYVASGSRSSGPTPGLPKDAARGNPVGYQGGFPMVLAAQVLNQYLGGVAPTTCQAMVRWN